MPEERPVSLVTGASAGIGLELARVFAGHHHDLVLVARREERLQALAEDLRREHGVWVHVLPTDLAAPDAAEELFAATRREGLFVEHLVNNAAFGLRGRSPELDRKRQLDMVTLNVTALTDLTCRYLGEMLVRHRGRILNVASTSAFQAGPWMAVYFATKAYVLHFTEALAEEVRRSGVTVTALCPGPTESEFWEVAGYAPHSGLNRIRAPAAPVARRGYRGMMRGRAIVVPGLLNRLGVLAVRFAPRSLVRRVIRRAQELL